MNFSRRRQRDPNDPYGVKTVGAGGATEQTVAGPNVSNENTKNTTANQTKAVTVNVVAQTKVLNKIASVPSSAVPTPPPTDGAINSMLTHLHSNSLPAGGVGCVQSTSLTTSDYKDPLRELVLISEAICVNDDNVAYQTNVKSLAKEATVLEHIKEVHPEQAGLMPLSPAPLGGQYAATPAAAAAVLPKVDVATKLNLFQDPKDMVDPVKEREFLKKLEALDDDSEGFDG